MSIIDQLIQSYEFNRQRTLSLLDTIASEANSAEILGWRPGSGRAHIAWQLMHHWCHRRDFRDRTLGTRKVGAFTELWPRFRGGSTPDDSIASVDEIRQVLADGRAHLIETLGTYSEDRLAEIPETLKERGLTVLNVLHILSWHESHHQGKLI